MDLNTKTFGLVEPSRLNILGLDIDNLTLAETVDLIQNWVEGRQAQPNLPGRMLITVNPEYIMAARRDPAFHRIVEQADWRTADGAGLLGCGRLWGQPFRGRVTGVALTHALAQRSAVLSRQHRQFRLFLLGAGPGVAEEAAAKLQALYSGVQIAGTFAGQADPEGDSETRLRVKAAEADIVLVAYGMGILKQDGWMARNLKYTNVAVAIGVGGVFDYLTGRVRLAPPTLRRLGLEWAYRLYKEPWRWRRMLILPQFAGLVLLQIPSHWWNKLKPN